MTEGTHIPGTPACGEWEAQLADALGWFIPCNCSKMP